MIEKLLAANFIVAVIYVSIRYYVRGPYRNFHDTVEHTVWATSTSAVLWSLGLAVLTLLK